MTPTFSEKFSHIFLVYFDGSITPDFAVYGSFGIRPVINIRSDVLISQGDGTSENPFILQLA